jgi:AcrR family transcriptional regulator
VALHKSHRPYGREEVVAAVVQAATTLFAERGPAAVSLREVAQAADVNLGLIHRHIGSKTDLLAAVLRARPGMEPGGATTADEGLDGYDLAHLGIDFPGLGRWGAVLRERLAPLDADIRLAFVVAMLLGWHAVGLVVLDVLGHHDLPPDKVVQSLGPALAAFVSATS